MPPQDSPEMRGFKSALWQHQEKDRQALEKVLSSSMGGSTENFIRLVCEHAKSTLRDIDRALDANPELKARLTPDFRRDVITDYVFNLKVRGGWIKIDLDQDVIIEILQSTNPNRAVQGQDHGADEPRVNPTSHSGPLTAWQAVCAAYPSVADKFQADGPPSKWKKQCALPSVRPLQERPVSKRPGQKSQGFTPGANDVNIYAALKQVSGEVSAVTCENCRRGAGRWVECVGAAFRSENDKDCCGNCTYSGNNTRCKPPNQ
ncbi:hypothetical protein F5Y18DRAFT_436637 [Xylariaceae sp. FL1019]|nr:hypothetical protein F5Y18DRAFT_436637 [Xylariaceae sp. FL1019]